MNPVISIVSPVYKAEKIVDILIKRIIGVVSKITENFEIILVEDGSLDLSWKAIEKACNQDKRIKGVKLSRNFGQHHAITAGLDYARGEWVVVMDCDLQDRPEEIINLYQKALSGFEIVMAQRDDRSDNFIKKVLSYCFYKVLSYVTGKPFDPGVANFGIYHRKVIQAINNLREHIRFFPTMVFWVGFSKQIVKVQHDYRIEGKTSYNLKKLFNLALDIILAYSDKPIRLVIKLGLIISLLSFITGIFMIMRYFNGSITVGGYTSLFVSICFFSGLIITTLGVVGLYVGKSFEATKNRPIYITQTTINCDKF